MSDRIQRLRARLARTRARFASEPRVLDPAELRPPAAPRLHHHPPSGGWFVGHDGELYEPGSDDDVDLLLTLLPVEILDDPVDPRTKRAGYVRVLEEGDRTSLELLAPYGAHVVGVIDDLDEAPAPVVEWTRGHHGDGWVETVAVLHLDGVRRCTIEAFIPESDGPDKTLTLVGRTGADSMFESFPIHRGQLNRIPVWSSPDPARGVVLTLQTSSAEPVDDERQLGFLLNDVETQQ